MYCIDFVLSDSQQHTGIRSANDFTQIMNFGNQFYSSLSRLPRQALLIQSELPPTLNVSDIDYQLEYSANYSDTEREISTVPLYKEPLSHSYLKNYTNFC